MAMNVTSRIIALTALVVTPAIADAQTFGPGSPATEVTLSVGRMHLQGNRAAPLFGAAVARTFGAYAVAEANFSYARVGEPFFYSYPADAPVPTFYPTRGGQNSYPQAGVRYAPARTATVAAELQLPLGRFAPYAGIGAGAFHWTQGAEPPSTSFVTKFGAGTRIAVTHRYAFRADVWRRNDAAQGRDVLHIGSYRSTEFQFSVARRF